MSIKIKPSQRGSLHRHLGVPQGEKIPASKLSIKSGDSPAIRKKKQFAINARKWKHSDGGIINIKPNMISPNTDYTMKKRHAYGSKINTTWSGGDVATAGLDTASGALGGAATGAMIGLAGGPIGVVGGAIIGGVVGLAKGILGSSSKARQRARLKEANRQQTIMNMDQRNQADMVESSYNNSIKPISFYSRGGKFFANGGTMEGINPISHDTQLANGPSHENGGIEVTPTDEIEGGETMKQRGNETLVFSDRLKVPGTRLTFADMSLPLMKLKGNLESKFSNNESLIEKERDVVNKPTSTKLVVGSASRRAQIASQKSDRILSEIGLIDNQLHELFEQQENINNNENPSKMRYGGKFKYADGGTIPKFFNRIPSLPFNLKSSISTDSLEDMGFRPQSSSTTKKGFNIDQLSLQAGADVLDTLSQSITSAQMSNLPIPTRSITKAPRFNTYVDNSRDISDIDSSVSQAVKFIKENTKNPAIRRASIMSIMNQANKARSSSFMNKTALERDLENKNTQLAFETGRENRDIIYNNAMMKYQSSIAGLTRQSQIASNFSDKIANLGVTKAANEANDIGFATILSQFPEGVRRSIIGSIKAGKSKRNAIMDMYQ